MYMLKCRPKLDVEVELNVIVAFELKREGFMTSSYAAIFIYPEWNVLRWYFQRYRCCGWHLVTQDLESLLIASHTAALECPHNVFHVEGHLGDRCLKYVVIQSQGQQVSEVFHTGAFYLSVSAENKRGNCGLWGVALRAPCCMLRKQPTWCCEDTDPNTAFWEALIQPAQDFHPSARSSVCTPPQQGESNSSSSEIFPCFAGGAPKLILEQFLKIIRRFCGKFLLFWLER